jgi:hypothetical protein
MLMLRFSSFKTI